MKGEITQLSRIIDENEVVRGYQIVIETKEIPKNVTLGEVSITFTKKNELGN